MEDGKKSIVNNVSADKVNSNESSPESEAVQTSDESSKHLSKKTESLESALRKTEKTEERIYNFRLENLLNLDGLPKLRKLLGALGRI